MGIIEYFKDWMANNEEKSKFKKAWINDKIADFRWEDKVDSYHAEIAYEIYQLAKKIEELEQKIK